MEIRPIASIDEIEFISRINEIIKQLKLKGSAYLRGTVFSIDRKYMATLIGIMIFDFDDLVEFQLELKSGISNNKIKQKIKSGLTKTLLNNQRKFYK